MNETKLVSIDNGRRTYYGPVGGHEALRDYFIGCILQGIAARGVANDAAVSIAVDLANKTVMKLYPKEPKNDRHNEDRSYSI